METKTVNRGWLKRQVAKGNVVCVETYAYDEMSGGEHRKLPVPVPVIMAEYDEQYGWMKYKPDFCQLREGDFDSSCGRAWKGANGFITLYVHSNLNYTLRIKEGK